MKRSKEETMTPDEGRPEGKKKKAEIGDATSTRRENLDGRLAVNID